MWVYVSLSSGCYLIQVVARHFNRAVHYMKFAAAAYGNAAYLQYNGVVLGCAKLTKCCTYVRYCSKLLCSVTMHAGLVVPAAPRRKRKIVRIDRSLKWRKDTVDNWLLSRRLPIWLMRILSLPLSRVR